MPRLDGTGPAGKGPFTGKGMGYCAVKIDLKDKEINNDQGRGVFVMPRGDGTGPAGLGPMTGRGAGYCAGYSVPGYMNPIFGRRGYFGRGGRGRRNWQRAAAAGKLGAAMGMPAFGGTYPYAPEFTPKQEADILRNEADYLKKQLEDIHSRIEILEKAQTEKSE